VKHDGDPEKSKFVNVLYTRGGKLYGVKARSVAMAVRRRKRQLYELCYHLLFSVTINSLTLALRDLQRKSEIVR
jgi:hypothetical protein